MQVFDHDLSVTICSWNTVGYLRKCLASLEAVRDECDFEVIVVDNNSQDGSADMVEAEFPRVRVFRMPVNLGFTGGHNYAFANRNGRHVFPLNSDAEVLPGCLSTILNFANENPDVGAIGPKVLNPDGSLQLSCRTFPHPMAALYRSTPLGKWFPNHPILREYLMTDWTHDSPRDVDWLSACAVFYSEKLLAVTGGFDEAFFMYCEDMDICYQSLRANLRVVYLPSAVATHAIGRSTDQLLNRMIVRHAKSMSRFYLKNMLPQAPLLAQPFLAIGAVTALTLRAMLLIAKNKVDMIRRKLK